MIHHKITSTKIFLKTRNGSHVGIPSCALRYVTLLPRVFASEAFLYWGLSPQEPLQIVATIAIFDYGLTRNAKLLTRKSLILPFIVPKNDDLGPHNPRCKSL